MKLIKLHIDNFGTLHNLDFDFTGNLNCICEENGYGKTTLAEFIKAMLYGFETSKAADLDKNEKKKYEPWQGGIYGGTLTFASGGTEYRIERTFKAGGKKQDTHFVYNLSTNKPTDVFKDAVGMNLFKIDAESFQKSVFVPQKELELAFNENLRSAVINTFAHLDDTQDVDGALKKIKDKEKALSGKKGKKGKINLLNDKLASLNDQIKSEEESVSLIPQLEKEKAELEAQKQEFILKQDKLTSQIEQVAKAAARKKDIEYSESMRINIEKHKQAYDDLKAKAGDKTTDAIQGDINKLKELSDALIGLNIKKDALNQALADVAAEYGVLKSLFQESPLDDDTLGQLENNINTYNSLTNSQNEIPASKKLSTPSLILVILGAVFFAGGLISLIFSLPIGIIVAGVGILSLMIGILLKSPNQKPKAPFKAGPDKVSLENDIKAFFAQYSLNDTDFSQNFRALKEKRDKYLNIKKEDVRNKDSLNKIKTEIRLKETEADAIFGLYKLNSLAKDEKLNELRDLKYNYENKSKELLSLQKEYETFIQKHDLNAKAENAILDGKALNEELKAVQDQINGTNQKLKAVADDLKDPYSNEQALTDDRSKKEETEANIKELQKEDELLKTTAELILKTRDDVQAKYIKPMTEKVKEHLDEFLGNADMQFNIDSNLEFSGFENGRKRDVKFYSRGYQQIIALSLRLALIECIFQNEKPFLLLDDPFASLDNIKLDQAKDVLKQMSKAIQVIYLTCHDSREII